MQETDSPDFKKARRIVYRLLNIRHRSEAELIDKLKAKNIPKSIIEHTLRYFHELELIDDELFTKQWITSRLKKPYGVRRIRFELTHKGVCEDIIERQLALAVSEDEECLNALRLAKRRAQSYNISDKGKIQSRIYGYLYRRGFSPQTINKAIQKI